VRRWSLRLTLAATMGVVAAAVIVTFGVAAYREMRSSALAAAENRLVAVTRQFADLLSSSAVTLRTTVGAAANDSALTEYLQHPTPAASQRALAAMRRLGGRGASAAQVELWDTAGRRVLATLPGVPPISEDEARSLLHSGPGNAWAALGPLTARQDTVSYTALGRASRDGRTLGYLAVRRRLTSSSNEAEQLRAMLGADMRIYLGNNSGDVWTDWKGVVDGPPVAHGRGAVVQSYDRPGAGRVLSLAIPIRSAPWQLAIEQPRETVLRGLYDSMRQLTIVAIVILILAAPLGWAISTRFTRPVSELADAAEAISRGDYARRVETTGTGELGALGVAFNHMGDSITAAHAALEDKVAEVATSERRLRQLISSSGVLLYELRLHDGRFRMEWISENISRMLGYSPADVRTPTWWSDNIHPDDRARLASRGAARLYENGADEFRFRDKAGRYHWIRDDRRRVQETDASLGDVTRLVGAWLDITEQRQLEDQLRQAQKMEAIGTLAGGVAHDFNNLLTVISSYTDLLLAGDVSASDRADLEEIAIAAKRGTSLTRQLLTFSRKAIVQPQPINVSEVVRGMEGMFRRLLNADVQLVAKLNDELRPVLADKGQLEQILVNLVINASDAMPNGGTLVIETQHIAVDDAFARTHAGLEPGTYVMLAVTDTGIGMDAATRSKIFEPFFTTKPVGKGTGLGLATVYAIVKEMGGQIWVYSEPSSGAAFKIYLPPCDADATRRVTPVTSASVRRTGTALLVEDDVHVRAAVRRMLERVGYTVLQASDGEDGLHVAARHADTIDLVVTDLMMPRMNGSDFVQALSLARPDVRVIFTSGYTDDAVMRRGLVSAAHTFLQKPFTNQQLAAAIEQLAAA
jgi:PAS domain S-box-containing protein